MGLRVVKNSSDNLVLVQTVKDRRVVEDLQPKMERPTCIYLDIHPALFRGENTLHFQISNAYQKTPSSLRRKQSDSSLTGYSDQKRRESKSAPYRDTRYPTLLAAKGSYMEESDLGIVNTSLSSYMALLSLDQTVPNESRCRDDVFEATCRSVQDRNEA